MKLVQFGVYKITMNNALQGVIGKGWGLGSNFDRPITTILPLFYGIEKKRHVVEIHRFACRGNDYIP